MSAQVFFIAGDIGGTNSRLQLIKSNPDFSEDSNGIDNEILVAEQYYPSKDFKSVLVLLETFLTSFCPKGNWPLAACLAVAGPISEPNVANVTNLKWRIDGNEISKTLKIKFVKVINDFEGIGYGLLALKPHDVYPLNNNIQPTKGAPIACIGAGTGLGECYLTNNGVNYDVWPSEGGHTCFAPRNEKEFKLMQFIKKAEKLERVSCERAISGLGLFHIYNFLKSESPHRVNKEVESKLASPNGDPNAIISQAALAGTCSLSLETMDLFMSLYGAEAGNLAIKTLPFGGLYIAGGIGVKNMHALLRNQNFYKAFLNKGRMETILNKVPIYVVLNQAVGLLGAKVVCQRLIKSASLASKL